MLKLPKPHFSYSQYNLWKKNREQYRRKYYYGEKIIDTPEMLYGKEIAQLIEDKAERLKLKLPHYTKSEYRLELHLDDVPVIAYLDGFVPARKAIFELKTGHLSEKGTIPWDVVKVQRHEQLPFYSVMVEEKFGKVQDLCTLIWLETKFKPVTVEFDGHELTGQSKELELTGRMEVFKRRIGAEERRRMRTEIIRVAHEISKDYEQTRA